MTDQSLDLLNYVKDMERAGLERPQAEAIARANLSMRPQRFETSITRGHFDATMGGVEGNIKYIEKRIQALDSIKSNVNLHTWLLGLIIVVLVVPKLQSWFAVG